MFQCPKCFGGYQGVISEDKLQVVFTHEPDEECDKAGKSIICSISDFSSVVG
jgi:hypothetical protein